MSTKGPSRRYGNTRGAHHRGEFSERIGYPWAKDFNKWTLADHFNKHSEEFKAVSRAELASKAVHFANEIDRIHYRSVVDKKGTTYKYDPRDGRLVIVSKEGYVITYYTVRKSFAYQDKKGKEVTIWIQKRNR